MADLAMTVALWLGAVLIVALGMRALRLSGFHALWFAAAAVIAAAYTLAIFVGGDILPLRQWIGPHEWNWGGKIVAIGVSLLLFATLTLSGALSRKDMGFTLVQKQGSLLPALVATALLAGSGIAMEIAAADGLSLGAERLAYQATMPGLDEELYFRGVLLAVLAAAVPSRGVNLLGARITAAGLLSTLLFGVGHGVFVADGAVQTSWLFVAVTAYMGFGLLWIRERTGSILIPILAHNAINLSGSFF
ncbi:MAG: CPBP family intramembrane glutamic endopeptidase [Parvularculaceae bacterium]